MRRATSRNESSAINDRNSVEVSYEEMPLMKLNHLNLTVTDVAETRKLFETYFGFTGLREVGNEKFALLSGEDGFVLNLTAAEYAAKVLQEPGNTALREVLPDELSLRGAQVSYPEIFHIGFMQESEERVNEINQRLKDDGFDVNPPKKFHGAWTFYFRAPGGGFLIEVLHQPGVPY